MVKLSYSKASTPRLVIFTAIASALGFVLNLISIPVAPHVNMTFGYLMVIITGFALGPIWGFIVGAISYTYTIILWGHPWGVILTGIMGLFIGWFARKFRPFVAAVLGGLIYFPILGIPIHYLWGYPMWLIEIIVVTFWVAMIINMIVAEILLAIPAVQKVIPGYVKPKYKYGFIAEYPKEEAPVPTTTKT